MVRIFKLVIALLCSLLPLWAAADIYSWVDDQGVRHFSDKPPQGAEKGQVKGGVEPRRSSVPINAMQPYIPRPSRSNSAVVEEGVSASDSEGARESGQISAATNQGKNDKSVLKDIEGQRAGYNLQNRVDEIRAEEAREVAEKKAIQEGTKTKDFSKPDTLNEKLKAYNAHKIKQPRKTVK